MLSKTASDISSVTPKIASNIYQNHLNAQVIFLMWCWCWYLVTGEMMTSLWLAFFCRLLTKSTQQIFVQFFLSSRLTKSDDGKKNCHQRKNKYSLLRGLNGRRSKASPNCDDDKMWNCFLWDICMFWDFSLEFRAFETRYKKKRKSQTGFHKSNLLGERREKAIKLPRKAIKPSLTLKFLSK